MELEYRIHCMLSLKIKVFINLEKIIAHERFIKY
jgi:hypothetical protein